MTTTMSTLDRMLRKFRTRYRRLAMIVIDISDIFILIFRRFVRSELTVMASKWEENTWSGFPIKPLGQSQLTGKVSTIILLCLTRSRQIDDTDKDDEVRMVVIFAAMGWPGMDILFSFVVSQVWQENSLDLLQFSQSTRISRTGKVFSSLSIPMLKETISSFSREMEGMEPRLGPVLGLS